MEHVKRIWRRLRDRRGSASVEFIASATLLILTFAVVLSALIYVVEYYNASYICRRVVRTIEVTGEYQEATVASLARELGGGALKELDITVDATYFKGRKIQLRDEFAVQLSAVHPVHILMLGGTPVTLELPINIGLSGRSEVYWKP